MLVYHFDEETKEFTYSEEATVDPLETKIKGEKVYLLPANATFLEPMDKENNKAVIFNGENWELIEDNRGKYTVKNGSVEEIKEIGFVEKVLTKEEIEKINNGELIIEGSTLREKNVEEKQKDIREVRNAYLEMFVDPKQLVMVWEGLSGAEKQLYKDYRQYLLDYTERVNWWEKQPLTFEEWKIK